MGILDHRRIWHFSVNATRKQCFEAFYEAMARPGFKFIGAKWALEHKDVSVSPDPTEPSWPASIATYQGRGGFSGIMTPFAGATAQSEEARARGSQVTFAIDPASSEGRSGCSMWLSKYSTGPFGTIDDARFMRSSLNDVEKYLRVLDPMLMLEKVKP